MDYQTAIAHWAMLALTAEGRRSINGAKGEEKPVEPTTAKVKVGRNEKCTCGSGLKFKKCCARVK